MIGVGREWSLYQDDGTMTASPESHSDDNKPQHSPGHSSLEKSAGIRAANALQDSQNHTECGQDHGTILAALPLRSEFSILTIMAYDRYIAICKPLHYRTIMTSRTCVNMAAAAWGIIFLYVVLHTANTLSLPLCQGNALDQFFCDIPQILKLSCSDAYLREVGLLMLSVAVASGCFVFLVLSYVQIFRAVLRIPSQQGRHKAFSMCLPHLAVVSLFISSGTFAYLKPPSMSSSSLNLLLAVLYSVVPPYLPALGDSKTWWKQ
ncbi:olfactory receptor 14C36-like [Aythya fuligula]|uniref:Olfactory receptor 14C36-like n=1 Tax=Aythya fuligula TaxID=219594 RepID=A0A6J3EFW9_AYTFU|nr:olfactory receptor 14C36-like [Aythya fuligula]